MNDQDAPEPAKNAPGGMISFDPKSLIRNPITWVAIGVGLTIFLQHQMNKPRAEVRRPMKNVTPGMEE